jgi:hypothetical protein
MIGNNIRASLRIIVNAAYANLCEKHYDTSMLVFIKKAKGSSKKKGK